MLKAITLFVSVLILTFSTFSQFTTIHHSTTNSFQFAEISEQNGIALIGGIKALKSIDEGYTWTEMNLGNFAMPWTLYSFSNAIIVSPLTYCLVGKDDTNKKGIIIRTTDGGTTWANVLESANGSSNYFADIHYNGNVAIATSKGGVYRSENNGATWVFVPITATMNITSNFVQYNAISNVWLINLVQKNLNR